MIALRVAMALSLVACWDAWRLLIGRVDDLTSAALILLVAGALAWRFVVGAALRIRAWPVAAGLVLYAIACLTGPALLQIGVATGVLTLVGSHGLRLPRLPLAGLATLLLPVLPTLDFLLAYPLRRVSAIITVVLLRMNGVGVTLDGIALEWRGEQLLFDGPCSGVRMLWATVMLASLVALVRRHRPLVYAVTLAIAIVISVLGNALRAASLFYLESGAIEQLRGPVAHEAVGLLSFAMVALAVVAATQFRGRTA